jgi:ketosteroid isomerase-like protein
LIAVAACAGAPPPVAPVEAPVEAHRAEADARGLIDEVYQAIGHGQTDTLFSRLSDPIVVFGPRKLDATSGRANALLALGKLIDSRPAKAKQDRLPLRSTGLHVATSPGGHSAWMSDVVYVDNQPLAVTAVLTNTGDVWQLAAAQLAIAPAPRTVHGEAARDAIVPPGSAASAHLDPPATDAIAKLKAGLIDQAGWGGELASRDDAMVIGPSAGELAHGKAAIDRMWKARLAANTREATTSELTSSITPDGQLAWLTGSLTRVADGADPLPLRVFAIYTRDGADWKLTVLHEAVAIDAPGAGTPFKSILPAAPPPPAVEPAKPAAVVEVAVVEPAQKATKPAAKTSSKPRPKASTKAKPKAKPTAKKKKPKPAKAKPADPSSTPPAASSPASAPAPAPAQ